jgi:hypothetical protein
LRQKRFLSYYKLMQYSRKTFTNTILIDWDGKNKLLIKIVKIFLCCNGKLTLWTAKVQILQVGNISEKIVKWQTTIVFKICPRKLQQNHSNHWNSSIILIFVEIFASEFVKYGCLRLNKVNRKYFGTDLVSFWEIKLTF